MNLKSIDPLKTTSNENDKSSLPELDGQRKSVDPSVKRLTCAEAIHLLPKSHEALFQAKSILSEARTIAHRSGLSVDSSVLDASYQSPFLPTHFCHGVSPADSNATMNTNMLVNHMTNPSKNPTSPNGSPHQQGNNSKNPMRGKISAFPPILSTTGGHSNTDHIIQVTGDHRADAIAEYKRKLKRRAKAMQPEQRGTDRWDQPRVSGSRRRRIRREKDLPFAPPEPPPSGYVIFVGQMTTKIRHDRPHVQHNQIKVVQEISKIWKFGMSSADRQYYVDFAREARLEYEGQSTEFRATGGFTPSTIFEKMKGGGPWVRIALYEKNSLEREIATYQTVKFPVRPSGSQKPSWEAHREESQRKESERQKIREEKKQKQREEEFRRLEAANRAKEKRLKGE
jgi:hypothetical protein